jgi:hypothetical protein
VGAVRRFLRSSAGFGHPADRIATSAARVARGDARIDTTDTTIAPRYGRLAMSDARIVRRLRRIATHADGLATRYERIAMCYGSVATGYGSVATSYGSIATCYESAATSDVSIATRYESSATISAELLRTRSAYAFFSGPPNRAVPSPAVVCGARRCNVTLRPGEQLPQPQAAPPKATETNQPHQENIPEMSSWLRRLALPVGDDHDRVEVLCRQRREQRS